MLKNKISLALTVLTTLLLSACGSSGALNMDSREFPLIVAAMLCCGCVVMIGLVIAVGLMIWRMNQGVKAGEAIPSADPDVLVNDPHKLAEFEEFDKPGGDFGKRQND